MLESPAPLRWIVGLGVTLCLCAAACADRNTQTPSSPSPAGGGQAGAPSGLSFAGGIAGAGAAWGARPGGAAVVSFPPRNESFDFRNDLESKYRYGMGRGPSSTFVDLEGDIVWTQEYLRYRVNACTHVEAVQRVMFQIDGGGVVPVCGQAPPGQVLFPPRTEPYDFRLQLETKYRDGLRRAPTSSYVDVEGSIVWTQEYLRYRVNLCSHDEATARVFAQIDGQGVQPDCAPASTTSLSGFWSGTGTYPNAPFRMTLVQTGTALSGQYADQLDRSLSVTGAYSAPPAFAVVVDFGDAKLNFRGTVEDARTIRGVMWTSALGNRQYPFTMTR